MDLKEKCILVIGAGTGIGKGIALAFARAGCPVAIAGRRAEKLQEAAAEWDGKPEIRTHTVDVTDRDAVDALVAWSTRELGRIDVLVNSAGINIMERTMAEMDPADWDTVMQINAGGAFNCINAVLPQMRERRDGLVININSMAGKRAMPLAGAAYSASKFAMSALGTITGLEEAENGIRVTNIFPGEVETPMLDLRPNPVSAEHRARILQPEDVAAAVLMIASLPPRAHIPELVIKPTTQHYA